MNLYFAILIMAKFQDLEILESAAYRQRNARNFCGTSTGQLSAHQQQHLMSPSVFLTSPEDSSFTFVLSDMPKSSTSTSVQNKATFQSYVDRHGPSQSQTTQPYYTTSSDQSSRTLPHKYHSKQNVEFENPETCVNYPTLETRKSQLHKLKGVDQQSNNLIEFGSPPHSPLRTSSNPQPAYQYTVPGKQIILYSVQ